MQTGFRRQYVRIPISVAIKNIHKEVEKLGIYISPPTLDHIADKAEKVPHGNKKNPLCFILGFYVVVDNKISKKKLQFVLEGLHKLEIKILPEDILRYARLFLK